jgi:hypothetical protein
MKILGLLLIAHLAILPSLFSQDYKTGIGIRLGTSAGISVKHSVAGNNYVEGILSSPFNRGGFLVTGLYEWQNALPTKNLSWYFGVGGHLGIWRDNRYKDNFYYVNTRYKNYGVIGIDGILGIEYVFDNAPIGLGLDWKPYVNLLGNSEFTGGEIALSARYTIK